jgi:choline kinase
LKVLILAAGSATRLKPLTDNLPKCMLTIGAQTIIERTISNLLKYGLSDITIVTGFLAETLQNFLHDKFPQVAFTYIHNADYATTNNIHSLWLAHNAIGSSEMLLLDSDIIFDHRIIKLLLDDIQPNALAMRSKGGIGVEEMKVRINSKSHVQEISKSITPESAAGESIGIEKFGRDFVDRLFQILDDLIMNQKKSNVFYELAFQQLISAGQVIKACDVKDLLCIEIDIPQDIAAATELVSAIS